MRRHALGFGLGALALVALATSAGTHATDQPRQSTVSSTAQADRATIGEEHPAVNVEAAPDGRSQVGDARRFDLPWAALASAAALLLAAFQRTSTRRSRVRIPAPLTTRAPARAPPITAAFAPAS